MTNTRPDPDTVRAMLEIACRAPSIHNSQPWRWQLRGSELRLYADPRQAVPAADPYGRQMTLSLGAVLDHFLVAAAAHGWKTEVSRMPNPNRPDHVATVEFAGHQSELRAFHEREDALRQRYTDRLPMRAPEGHTVHEVADRARRDSDAHLCLLRSADNQTLSRASRASLAERRYDLAYQSEIDWWTTRYDESEGIPPASLLTSSEAERVSLARDFPPVADGQPRRADIPTDEASVFVLASYTGNRIALLRCGEALSSLLIEATLAGLSTCTVSHVMESPDGKAAISRLIEAAAEPQLLVRAGVREERRPPVATPRRPVDDVLDII